MIHARLHGSRLRTGRPPSRLAAPPVRNGGRVATPSHLPPIAAATGAGAANPRAWVSDRGAQARTLGRVELCSHHTRPPKAMKHGRDPCSIIPLAETAIDGGLPWRLDNDGRTTTVGAGAASCAGCAGATRRASTASRPLAAGRSGAASRSGVACRPRHPRVARIPGIAGRPGVARSAGSTRVARIPGISCISGRSLRTGGARTSAESKRQSQNRGW
jgi:hypothetical protein